MLDSKGCVVEHIAQKCNRRRRHLQIRAMLGTDRVDTLEDVGKLCAEGEVFVVVNADELLFSALAHQFDEFLER